MVQILNWLGREVKDDGWYNGWMMFHNGMVWMMEPFFYWVPD
jgi:CYTH domain-containing protein